MKTFKFSIHNPGENAAGLSAYDQEITVKIKHDDSPAIEEDLIEHLKCAIADFYDGASVGVECISVVPVPNKKDNLKMSMGYKNII